MGSDSSVLISVMMMVAVTAAIVYDMLVERPRLGRARREVPARARRDSPPEQAATPAARRAGEGVADFATAHALPGTMGDDVIRELSERLAALRLLGFDYVRTAHPLFRERETDAGAAGVAAATALSESAAVTVPAPPRRRRGRHVRLRGTATLRLVVDRRAPLPGS